MSKKNDNINNTGLKAVNPMYKTSCLHSLLSFECKNLMDFNLKEKYVNLVSIYKYY